MAQREDDIRKIVEGARARGMGDDQIRALVARYDERATEQAQQQPTPSTPAGGMLPTAGAFGGSLLGTVAGLPGRIVGAGVGGALGKGAEMFFDEKDDSVLDTVKAMGGAGMTQAGAELAGGALGKGLKALGGGLYRVALRPAKALQQEFPDVVKTGIKEGLPVTRRGAEKAGERMAASAQKADDKIALMERAGTPPVRTSEVLRELRPVYGTLKKRAEIGLPDERPALSARAKTFAASHKKGIPLTKAQGLKREAQDMADTAYRAQEKGAVIKSDDMLANRAMATGLRKGIEARVPGVADINQRTRSLMGLSQALDDATTRNLVSDRLVGGAAGLSSGLVAGHGDPMTGALGMGAAASAVSPAVLSRLGLLGTRAGGAAAFAPQALRAAVLLQQLLASGTPEQGDQ